MPIYEYECPKCGTIEVIQKISESPLKKCPECGKPVRKLISQTSFQLKGTGWYATDYKKSDSGGNGRKPKEEPTGPKVDLAKEERTKESSQTK